MSRICMLAIHKRSGNASSDIHPLDTKPPLPADAPIYVAAWRHDTVDLAAELLFQRWPPGHELKPHAIVDHGEAAGRERDPPAVDTRDVLTLAGRVITEPRLR